MEKEKHGKEGFAATQSDWKWNSGFEKKENWRYEIEKHRIGKKLVLVLVKFLNCFIFLDKKNMQRVFGNAI